MRCTRYGSTSHFSWGLARATSKLTSSVVDFSPYPDEILSTVLEYAALRGPWGEEADEEDEEAKDNEKENIVYTVKSRTKLSHVCKRFRDLVTRSPRLWKCVFNGMGRPDMVSTCLSRCRRGNGEVTLSSSLFDTLSSLRDTYNNTPFIQAVLKEQKIGEVLLFEVA